MRRNRQLHDFSSYRINHFGSVFTGYSLYEVDGTFDGGALALTWRDIIFYYSARKQ